MCLGEHRISSMSQLEHGQQRRKAYVDRHCRLPTKHFEIGQLVLVFQTKLGAMPGKLRFRWMGPFWIIDTWHDTFQLGTVTGEALSQWVNGFRLKPYHGPTPPNPFINRRDNLTTLQVGTTAEPTATTPDSR